MNRGKSFMEEEKSDQKKQIPRSWKMRLIEGLGLKNYLVKNFVFRPPQCGYQIEEEVYLKFYPLYQNQKINVDYLDFNIKTYILHSQQQNKLSYVPLIYLTSKEFVELGRSETVCQIQDVTKELKRIRYNDNDNSKRSRSLIESDQYVQFDRKIVKEKAKKKVQQPVKTKQPQKLLIIYSHGNASDLGDVFFFAEKMIKEYDVDMIAYDYTGYGLGIDRYQVNEQQTYQDLQNVLSFAVVQLGYNLNQIVLWGFSLGSGPTTEIASRFTSLAGVILQAPLASMLLWLDEDKDEINSRDADLYSNINKIQSLKSKILIMHGEQDTVINIRHSHLLYEKYLQINRNPSNIWFISVHNQNHNNLQTLIENADSELGKRIFRFLKEIILSNNYHFYQDWPYEEICRRKRLQEIKVREMELLNLLSDDFKVSTTLINPTQEETFLFTKIPQAKIQIKPRPIDDLQGAVQQKKLKKEGKFEVKQDGNQNHSKNNLIMQFSLCQAQD